MKHYYASMLAGVLALGTATGVSASVATVNGTEYDTLAEAFAAADGTNPIELGEDVTVAAAIPVNTSVTLNLNGHTITNNVTNNRLFQVGNATFTIEGNGGSVITSQQSSGVVALTAGCADATLVVNDANFTGNTNDGSYFKFFTSGQTIELNNVNATLSADVVVGQSNIVFGSNCSVNLTVNGGTYVNDQTFAVFTVVASGGQSVNPVDGSKFVINNVTASSAGGPVLRVDGGDATVTDCTFTSNNGNSENYNNSALAVANGGGMTVNGGTYTGKYAAYIFNSGGKITIEDGTMNGIVQADESDSPHKPAELVLDGGTFNGKISVSTNADCYISGGEYKNIDNLDKYCVDGFAFDGTANAEGYYAAVEAVATVNGTPYKTVEDAFAAAATLTNPYVKLYDNVAVSSVIAINGDLTLDLNGKTVTNNVVGDRMFKVGNATFTIEGNGGSVITSQQSSGVVALTAGCADATLVVNDANFTGNTNDGSYFKFFTSGQTIELNNVNATLSADVVVGQSNIVFGSNCSVNLTVNGGTYVNDQTFAVFTVVASGGQSVNPVDGSKFVINNVTASSAGGPVLRVDGGDATVTDCTFTSNNGNSENYNNSALAVANGGGMTVNGGTYTGKYAAYIFNSGGNITIEDGTMNGIVQADESDSPHKPAELVLDGGTYNDKITVAPNADCIIYGGKFKDTTGLDSYCAEGYEFGEPDADGYSSPAASTSSVIDIVAAENVDPAKRGVFNLAGVRVADSAEGIAPGIYVIDGKTTLVK